MDILLLLFLVAGVSLDGMGVGIAFGLSRIRLTFSALVLVSFTSFLLILLALLAGEAVATLLPANTSARLGGLLLLLIGIALFVQAEVNGNRRVPRSKVHLATDWPLGNRLIYILKNPMGADLDASGSISRGEAVLLGLALALDAFGAGFGVALMGFPVLLTSLAAGLGKFVFIGAGYYLGSNLAGLQRRKLIKLPGLLLICLGLLKLLGV